MGSRQRQVCIRGGPCVKYKDPDTALNGVELQNGGNGRNFLVRLGTAPEIIICDFFG